MVIRIRLCLEMLKLNSVSIGLVRLIIYDNISSSVMCMNIVRNRLMWCVSFCFFFGSLFIRMEMKMMLLMLSINFSVVSVKKVI